jgi:hypothetical protein
MDQSDTSPPTRGNRKHPLRAKQDQASPRGGKRRSRGRGRPFAAKWGPDCRDFDAVQSRQYRFPDTPATASQKRKLHEIAVGYLRHRALHRFGEFGTDVLADAIGLAERQTATLAKEVSRPGRDETVELAKRVLHAMLNRDIAGTLGTEHTKTSRALFRLVSTIRISEANVTGSDVDAFTVLMAAFRLDYGTWKEERTKWPYTCNGEDRKNKSHGLGSERIE